MEENIINLFKNSRDYYTIFSKIFKNNDDSNYIKEVIDIIINKCLWYVLDYEDMIENLFWEIDDETIDKYIEDRFDDIISRLNPNSLIYLKKHKDKINSVLNSNPYKNIKEIVKHQCFESLHVNSNDYDEEFLTNLILDILKNEEKQVSDIKYDHGTFSNIYFIGDKVLKLGHRETFRLKYDKRYLRPALRHEYLIGNQKICIELTEKVSNDVSYDDLSMIVNEFKAKGKNWEDASLDNIGRLIKPNKVYYKRKIYADNGYIETDDSKIILPAGEIVILDNDHIFEEEKNYVYRK